MNIMNLVRTVIGAGAVLVSCQALPQAANDLPAQISGRWNVVTGSGRALSDQFIVRIVDQDKTGAVKGTLTHHGPTCGGKDEPFAGTWDGTTLRFSAMLKSNVNTQHPNQCSSPTVHYELRKREGGFEGTLRNDAGVSGTLTGSAGR